MEYDSAVHVLTTSAERSLWTDAANAARLPRASWIRERLREAAAKELQKVTRVIPRSARGNP